MHGVLDYKSQVAMIRGAYWYIMIGAVQHKPLREKHGRDAKLERSTIFHSSVMPRRWLVELSQTERILSPYYECYARKDSHCI